MPSPKRPLAKQPPVGCELRRLFIRRHSMLLGDGAQDGSAVPDDFSIAEVYKQKDSERYVHLFLFLESLSFLADEAIASK
jgi:hypothetical protein